MKKHIFIFSILSLISINPLAAAKPDLLSESQRNEPRIIVNNRILAKINGKLISTHDVMKKMDMLFYKQFPQYVSSAQGRFQFYQANWRSVLDDLINKELILADAEENKIEISNGDVRQEMEALFGPNIVTNLNKIGMSFDEASEILKGELTLRRMVSQRVHNKALRLATPNKSLQAYVEFIQNPKNARATEWRYEVLTIRDRNANKAVAVADASYRLLIEESIPFDQIPKAIKEKQLAGRKTKITLSAEIKNSEKDLSNAHKEALLLLDSGMYSQPVLQSTKNKTDTVYRIFYVKERIPGGFAPYKEMEPVYKEKILSDTIDSETEAYIKKLRDHFHIRESDLRSLVPDDYQPFILKQ
jgi:hypothetical protein